MERVYVTVLLEYLTQPCIQKPTFGMIQCIYSWKIIPLSGHNIVLKPKQQLIFGVIAALPPVLV